MVPILMTSNDLQPRFQGYELFNTKLLENTAYKIVTTADQYKVINGLSNRAIFNHLERSLTQFSRSLHSLMLDISQTAKTTAIATIKCE